MQPSLNKDITIHKLLNGSVFSENFKKGSKMIPVSEYVVVYLVLKEVKQNAKRSPVLRPVGGTTTVHDDGSWDKWIERWRGARGVKPSGFSY